MEASNGPRQRFHCHNCNERKRVEAANGPRQRFHCHNGSEWKLQMAHASASIPRPFRLQDNSCWLQCVFVFAFLFDFLCRLTRCTCKVWLSFQAQVFFCSNLPRPHLFVELLPGNTSGHTFFNQASTLVMNSTSSLSPDYGAKLIDGHCALKCVQTGVQSSKARAVLYPTVL